MTEYSVSWTIELEAESAVQAANKARQVQIRPGTTAVIFAVDIGNPQGPEKVDLLDYPELLEDADQSALAEKLLTVFPWLDLNNDEPISGADTIDDLQQLYYSLRATQHA